MFRALTTALFFYTTILVPQFLVATPIECRNLTQGFRSVYPKARIAARSAQGFYLYRAITGKGTYIDDNWVFTGVSDSDISSNGIFHSNQSDAQYSSQIGEVGAHLRVNGLPVFFNFEEALSWIKEKKYLQAPAIARVWVNLELVASNNRQFVVYRNHWDGKVIEQTPEMLLEHISGTSPIRGEAYIRSENDSPDELIDLLRPFEEVMRPPESNYLLFPQNEALGPNRKRQEPPLYDPFRIYNTDFDVPKILLRVTKIRPENLFSDDHFLRNHSYLSTVGGGPYARTVPMIHSFDLPTILRLFRADQNDDTFFVILIDSSQVLHLTHAQHSRLPKNGEFFGEVPRSAVVEVLSLKTYLNKNSPIDQ